MDAHKDEVVAMGLPAVKDVEAFLCRVETDLVGTTPTVQRALAFSCGNKDIIQGSESGERLKTIEVVGEHNLFEEPFVEGSARIFVSKALCPMFNADSQNQIFR